MEKVKADLHNHLRTSSRFKQTDFNKAINIAEKRLGKGGILGLVNFEDKRYERFIGLKGYDRVYLGSNKNAIFVPEKSIVVLKGQEVPTQNSHILVLGLEKDVRLKSNRSLEDSVKEAKDNNGIIILDHPYYLKGTGKYVESKMQLLYDIDAIEVFNGEAGFGIPFTKLTYNANNKAQEWYNKIKKDYPRLGALSGSDGHSFYEIGKCWTEIDRFNVEDKDYFVNNLRRSIRNTNNGTQTQKTNLIVGAIDHIVDLILITKIAPMLGIQKRFKVEVMDLKEK